MILAVGIVASWLAVGFILGIGVGRACALNGRFSPTDFTRAENERPTLGSSLDAINTPEPRVSGRYRGGSGAQSHLPHGRW